MPVLRARGRNGQVPRRVTIFDYYQGMLNLVQGTNTITKLSVVEKEKLVSRSNF